MIEDECVAIQVTSHEHLVQALVEAMPVGAPIIGDVLRIHMDECDTTVSFPTFSDIPDCTLKCPCGNPQHYLIRYER